MMISTRIKLAVLLWLVAETFAFSLVAHWIGLGDAILLGILTSLLGFSLLRRAGTSALAKLRARMEGQPVGGASERHHFLDETLATIGAVALLVPGFLSDVVGLALAVPALRDGIVGWVRRGGADVFRSRVDAFRPGRASRHGPAIIDLAPEEWRHADQAGGQPVGKS